MLSCLPPLFPQSLYPSPPVRHASSLSSTAAQLLVMFPTSSPFPFPMQSPTSETPQRQTPSCRRGTGLFGTVIHCHSIYSTLHHWSAHHRPPSSATIGSPSGRFYLGRLAIMVRVLHFHDRVSLCPHKRPGHPFHLFLLLEPPGCPYDCDRHPLSAGLDRTTDPNCLALPLPST